MTYILFDCYCLLLADNALSCICFALTKEPIYIYQCAKGIQVSPSVFGSGPNEWSSTWKAVRGGPNETE